MIVKRSFIGFWKEDLFIIKTENKTVKVCRYRISDIQICDISNDDVGPFMPGSEVSQGVSSDQDPQTGGDSLEL